MAQRAAGEYDGGKIGFDGERAPERLGDDHGLGEALAQAAMLLGKRHRQQPEVGVLLPQRGAVALRFLHVGEALIELAIVGGQQSLEAVFELPLLVVEIEVHELCSPLRRSGRRCSYCDPRTLAAAMPAPMRRVPPRRLKAVMTRGLAMSRRARDATRP